MEKSLGQVAYEAYCGSNNWKSYVTGQDLPQWNQVKEEIQNGWEIVASEVVHIYTSKA